MCRIYEKSQNIQHIESDAACDIFFTLGVMAMAGTASAVPGLMSTPPGQGINGLKNAPSRQPPKTAIAMARTSTGRRFFLSPVTHAKTQHTPNASVNASQQNRLMISGKNTWAKKRPAPSS